MDDMNVTNGGGFWIFALLILLFGSNGFGGFGGNNRAASIEDLNASANATRVEAQIRANAGLTETKTDAINNGLCSLGYEMAGKFAATNELIMAENQKTRDLIQGNRIAELEAQVSELKTQQMFCGVPRINPYGYGVYPYNNGCGGCNGNSSI